MKHNGSKHKQSNIQEKSMIDWSAKQTQRMNSSEQRINKISQQRIKHNNSRTTSADQDLFVDFEIGDVKRRTSAFEKSGAVIEAKRLDVAQAMPLAAGQRELSQAVGTGHQLTHKALAGPTH